MIKFLLILILTLLAWTARMLPDTVFFPDSVVGGADSGTLVLGLLLVSAWVFGTGTKKIHIPMLSGFLLYGMVAGPHGLGLIKAADLDMLRFTDFFALSLIAITAGGELKISSIRSQISLYSFLTGGQFLIVGSLMTALIYLIRPHVPLFAEQSGTVLLVMALITAVMAVANSPATVLAVMKEQDAKGPNSELLLGVAVFIDIFIILIFAVLIAGGLAVIQSDGGHSILEAGFSIFSHIFLSVIIGLVLGGILIIGLRFLNYNLTMVLVLLVVAAYLFVQIMHLEAMLTCMVAGFTVQNFSRQGEQLIKSAERSSMPFFIIFFTLAGAKLDFNILRDSWPIALTLVGARILFIYAATWSSVKLAGGSRPTRSYLWMGYLAQAGVSLGLVSIFRESYAFSWAQELATLFIAVIAVNQIIGPIMLKYALYKLKEIPG